MLEALFGCVVAVVLPVRAWRRYRRSAPPSPPGRYLTEALLLTGALGWLLWRHGVSLHALGLQPDSPARLLVDVLVCVTVVIGVDVWSLWRATRRIRRGAAFAAPDRTVTDALLGGRQLASFIAVAGIGAVWEELCFRATVFQLVPRTLGGLALGLTGGSLLFGAQHLRNGRTGFVHTAVLALLFSMLYLVTGDLIGVIVAHAAANILAVVQWAPRLERARRSALRQVPTFIG